MTHSKAVLEDVGSIETLRISMVRERTPLTYKLATPFEAAEAARQLIGEDLDREVFGVLLVNTRHRVTAMHVVSVGSLDGTLVHPREVFKCAILGSAAAIIIFHNHPSGDPAPSREDIALTKRLVTAGKLLGIQVLDHVVLGDDGAFVSFKEQESPLKPLVAAKLRKPPRPPLNGRPIRCVRELGEHLERPVSIFQEHRQSPFA